MSLSDDAVALAVLYVRRRIQGAAALTLDAWERWGNGSRFDELDHHMALEAAIRPTEQAMREGAQALDPATRRAFAEAWIGLLDAFIAANDDRTRLFVAREERDAWLAFAAGKTDFVDHNHYYVRFEPAAVEAVFGFDPGAVDGLG